MASTSLKIRCNAASFAPYRNGGYRYKPFLPGSPMEPPLREHLMEKNR